MTDYRDAKAEAKATKARAKAMRPWFKKKRIMIPLVFVLFVVIAAAASGGSDNSTNLNASDNSPETSEAAAAAPTTPGVRQGLGTKDASADVELISCARDQYLGRKANIKVTNHSSKPSNYIIEVVFESADGKEQLGTGSTFVNGLEPGQSKQDDVIAFDSTDSSTPGKCRVSSVQRNAA